MTPPVRAVIDTNILISGHLWPQGAPGRVLGLWRAGRFEMLVNPAILEEVDILAGRRKFARYRDQLVDLHGHIARKATLVLATATPPVLPRDPDDAHLLGTLLAAGADCLVSGDDDLLTLAGSYPILTAAQFLDRLGASA